MSICLIDTSVFCNIVDLPGKNQQRPEVIQQLEDWTNASTKTTLLLPLATIVETGNHIGQLSEGGIRRLVAIRFIEQVNGALAGILPWIPTPFPNADELRRWLNEFQDHACRGSGLGDLSIIKEWDRQRLLNPRRRVFIWAYDHHLASYDSGIGQ